MSEQADPAVTAVELFKTIVASLGKNAPNNAEEQLALYDQCLQHVGYTNSSRQNEQSRLGKPKSLAG